MIDRNVQTILIVGGTGTLGQALCRFFLDHTEATIRIFSRGELLQAEMAHQLNQHPRVRWMLGDVRNYARLEWACHGADLVIHAAALKHIDKGEYDPSEFIATNITGTENVIRACMAMGVKKAVLLSTDKASSPINTYGATKLVAERLFQRGNGYRPDGTVLSCVRYANVRGSRGSVLETWRNQRARGERCSITSPVMTRFDISIDAAVRLVWFAAQYAPRGGILVPHLPAYHVTDLLLATSDEGEPMYTVTGLRPGEKLAEQLLNEAESTTTLLYAAEPGRLTYYCVPPVHPSWAMPPWQDWPTPAKGSWEPFPVEQAYTSDAWPWRLSVEELRQRLEE